MVVTVVVVVVVRVGVGVGVGVERRRRTGRRRKRGAVGGLVWAGVRAVVVSVVAVRGGRWEVVRGVG